LNFFFKEGKQGSQVNITILIKINFLLLF